MIINHSVCIAACTFLPLIHAASLSHRSPANTSAPVSQITCGGNQYTYQSLAGYGFIAADARDKFGDTLGGLGSAIAVEKGSWKKQPNGTYTGLLWTLPDRGWNTEGTLNYQNRLHLFSVQLTPKPEATVANPSGPNFQLTYLDTVKFTAPDGQPTTGLDASADGPYLTFPGLDFELPSAVYPGDGFGGPGAGGKRVSVDSEGLVIDNEGFFWVSDEYGPYIYRISKSGQIVTAIRPPDAFIPRRNATVSFNSDTAPNFDPDYEVDPADPDDGRSNNQGFEGLTISPDGKTLYVLLQSATIQDGGSKNKNRRNTRFLVYDITQSPPTVTGEYVVQLPFYPDGSKVTAQSEIHYITSTQFLILSRDSNSGAGLGNATQSVYREVDIFDVGKATNVQGAKRDAFAGQVASTKGDLQSGITPATYCPFLDYNNNAQLNRFGVRNGGPPGAGLLNEKWESLALVPVDGNQGADGEFFLISLSDNDFITQNGYLNNGQFKYRDSSGNDLLNQALVFQIKVPASNSSLY